MLYFLWSLPALVVLATILSGHANITIASILGLMTAIPVALFAGPTGFETAQLSEALLRGLWIGAVIAPYILGGLLFWQIAARGRSGSSSTPIGNTERDSSTWTPLARRRLVFFACFLVGPFAESVTGFGVGMLGTVILLRRFNFAARHLMIFALLSQTVIPWGAMSSGTLLAAAYALATLWLQHRSRRTRPDETLRAFRLAMCAFLAGLVCVVMARYAGDARWSVTAGVLVL